MSDTDLSTRVAVLERDMHHIDATLTRLDTRLDRIETRMDQLDSRVHSNFLWLLGAMMAVFGGLLLTMAKGFHWIS